MAQIKEVKQCYNCGSILQCDDPSQPGYIKKELLESEFQPFYFCEECFRKEKYHEHSNEPDVSEDLLKLIRDAKKKNALIVYVVNLVSFEASFSSKINEILSDTNILVVASKFDLLPEGTDPSHVKKYVAHRFLTSGLKVKLANILIESAFDDEAIRAFGSKVYELKGDKDVYVIGAKLSGKTTLLNAFLKVYKNLSNRNIVTDRYPGTDIRVMKIPLNKNETIYDVPGIDDNNSILHNLDQSTLRKIYLTKPVEKRVVYLSKVSALFIGGIAMVSLVKDNKKHRFALSCYFHDAVDLKKVVNHKVEEGFIKAISKGSLTPSLKSIKSIKDLDIYEVDANDKLSRDINIQGLGWISYLGHGEKLRIYVPKGVSITLSSNKIASKKAK